MSPIRCCPRCGEAARPPGLWSSSWTCITHGSVRPVHPAMSLSAEKIRWLGEQSCVPVWLPWPLPQSWIFSGVAWAGDERDGPVATAVAISGPNPLPEAADDELAADLVIVAEQPGVGWGAHLAGLSGPDPGLGLRRQTEREPAHIKINAAGHDVPLWSVPVVDGVGYVGEAAGEWLWVLVWPAPAAAVLLERFALVDARDPALVYDLPHGAMCRRLWGAP